MRTGHAETSCGMRVGGATRVTSAPSVVSSHTFERATRECSTSPTIVTRMPARSRPRLSSPKRRLRIVKASSSACVGCSCVPSPALTTPAEIQPLVASVCGAPEAPWRISTASAPIACRVCAVACSDSPLLTDDPFAEKLMTSAERRFAAASNEMRVRVESSKKRLTTVLPRSVGSFLTSRDWVSRMSSATSRMRRASSRARVLVSSRCLMMRSSPLRCRRSRRGAR